MLESSHPSRKMDMLICFLLGEQKCLHLYKSTFVIGRYMKRPTHANPPHFSKKLTFEKHNLCINLLALYPLLFSSLIY